MDLYQIPPLRISVLWMLGTHKNVLASKTQLPTEKMPGETQFFQVLVYLKQTNKQTHTGNHSSLVPRHWRV